MPTMAAVSTLPNIPNGQSVPVSQKDDDDEESQFQATYQWILDDIHSLNGDPNGNFIKVMAETNEYIKTCMNYNVPHGKKIRGKMVVMVYKSLVPNATQDELKLARILGWCAEALQAAYLVADDIMDNGETRRGQPCWYLVNDLGTNALNDSFLLEHAAYQILLKYFGHLPCSSDLLSLLLGVTYKTILGQGMDIRTSKTRDMTGYNDQLYNTIVTYKTGFYTVYLPVALGMVYAGIGLKNKEHERLWQKVEQITLDIGRLFQIQDDYIDCFGDKDVIGKKIGTDIEEGKCTWLFVKAKEICDESQLKILYGNYGSADKVELVRTLYKELELPRIFAQYQEGVHSDIQNALKDLEDKKLEKVLGLFVKMIYKRAF